LARRRLAALSLAFATATGLLAGVAPSPASAAGQGCANGLPLTCTNKWIRTLPGAPIKESSPVVSRLDGRNDILVGAFDGNLYAVHGNDGTNVGGFPKQLGHPIDATASTGDAFHTGGNQIFIGSGVPGAAAGDFFAINPDGSTRWSFHPSDNDFPNLAMFSSPALGDVNGDGTADVSAFALGLKGWSFSADGALNGGWPFYQDDTVFSSPALYDIDGDGKSDYVVGGDSTAGGPVDHRGGFLRVLRGDGSLIWQFPVDEMVRSSPVVADIDGDGQPEIIFGTGDYWVRQPGGAHDSTKLFVLDRNGHLKWSRDLGGYTSGSPAVADVNHDGKLDVVMGTWGDSTTRKLWVFNGDGSANPAFAPRDDEFGPILGQPVTADFNGDGFQDILVMTGGGGIAFSGANGSTLFKLPSGVSYLNSAWVGDVDGNGKLDVVAAGTSGNDGVIADYEFNAPATLGTTSWSQFRGDPRLTGSKYYSTLSSDFCNGTPDGYYMAARDGGVFSYCNAPFFGSMGGQPIAAPVVGMSTTPSRNGYWEVGADGGTYAFGGAGFHGSASAYHPASAIVAIASTPSGNGYWEVSAQGAVYSFGDAPFKGSVTGGLNSPIVGIAAAPDGNGYWLAAKDGGVFAFGSAGFKGSMGGQHLNQPIVGIESTGDGGYWMVASDGGIFAFGAPFYGSTGGQRLNQPIVGMRRSASGGYRLVAADGGIFAYNSSFLGSTGSIRLNQPIVAMGS